MTFKVGLVGARGYTGGELVKLLAAHPSLELAFAVSTTTSGQRVDAHIAGVETDLVFEALTPEDVAARDVDAVVLALSNNASGPWLAALYARASATGKKAPVVVDLSADHRFNEAWAYGLPELFRASLKKARCISNPGCYATGAQLGIAPLRELLSGPPHVFGVSGYSGAGATPSPKNDVDALRDNLMPYALTDHVHAREISRHMQRDVFFTPHVAPFFRGITLTVSLPLKEAVDADFVRTRFADAYRSEPLIRVVDGIPLVRDAANRHDVTIGGFAVEGSSSRAARAVVIVTLDNLLKGAATQALQNLNLALGLDELAGVPLS
jgi:N-acetyl-gamma-glutamyl-phosphate reductase